MRTIKILIVSIVLSSCMTTKTSTGSYMLDKGETSTYARTKQVWLCWGVIPVGRSNVKTPVDKDFQLITRYNLIDFLAFGITGGFVKSYSIIVKTKNKISNDVKCK